MRHRITGQRYFDYAQADQRLRADLLGHWIGDGSGNTLRDRSGFGNHGTLTNGPTWTLGVDGTRHCLRFDGVNNYVNAGDIEAIDTASQLTVSAWVYHNSITNDAEIVDKGDINNGFIFWRDVDAAVSHRTNTYSVFIADGADGDIARIEGATNASPLQAWTQVTFTLTLGSSTGLRLYVNGKEDANSPVSLSIIGSINSGTDKLLIGIRKDLVTNPFNGLMDDVRIYNRALLPEEVWLLYTTTKRYILPMRRVAYSILGWKFYRPSMTGGLRV